MTVLKKDQNLSAEAKEKLELLTNAPPSALSQGAGGSGKILAPCEEHTLRGEEAAAYGRAMLENAVGGPEKLAENLKKYRES